MVLIEDGCNVKRKLWTALLNECRFPLFHTVLQNNTFHLIYHVKAHTHIKYEYN